MAGAFTVSSDFEKRYFDLVQENFAELKREVKENTALTRKVHEQAKKTNGRVTKAEGEIKLLQKQVSKRFNFQIDNKTLYILSAAFFVLLLIIARILHINVTGAL